MISNPAFPSTIRLGTGMLPIISSTPIRMLPDGPTLRTLMLVHVTSVSSQTIYHNRRLTVNRDYLHMVLAVPYFGVPIIRQITSRAKQTATVPTRMLSNLRSHFLASIICWRLVPRRAVSLAISSLDNGSLPGLLRMIRIIVILSAIIITSQKPMLISYPKVILP